MKKIAFLVGLSTLFFQSDGAIDIGYYRYASHKFGTETRLSNGWVLLNSGMVKSQRFFGNNKYDFKEGINNNKEVCSFLDNGLDSMSDLTVQLFPSAGISLNAQGTGSIQHRLSKSKKRVNIVDVIAGMFKIEADIRKNGKLFEMLKKIDKQRVSGRGRKKKREKRNKLKKEFLEKCFNLQSETPDSYGILFNLVNNIVNAIQLEREEGRENQQKSEKPYPPFYTNYLICAYAWNVLKNSQLDEFAEKLGYNENRALSEDEFTKRIYEDVTINPAVVPFYAGDVIINNYEAKYGMTKFRDCTETMLRQFCAVIFCKVSTDKDGKYTGLELDLSRIPDEATALREFFAPGGVPRDIRELANDGTEETRNSWAKVVSGLSGIDYQKTDCELSGNWLNFIKTFCFLMKRYTEANGSREAAECIKNVNNVAATGTLSFTKETLLETLNNLLKIRTDIEMIAEERKNSKEGGLKDEESDISGEISIFPNLDLEKYDKDVIESNRLNFVFRNEHGALLNIPRTNSSNKENDITKPWIERLYDNKQLAIRGENGGVKSQLGDSLYPLLDFCTRLGEEGQIDKNTLQGVFSSSMPHIDAIARYFISQYYLNYGIFFKIMHYKTDLEEPRLLKQKRKRFVKSILMFSDKMSTTKWVVGQIDPEKLSELFLKEDKQGIKKLSVNITDKTSIEKLIALRVITKRCEEIDPFIEKFIEKTFNSDTFNVNKNQAENVWNEFNENVLEGFSILKDKKHDTPRFKKSMFYIFIECLNGILESPLKDSAVFKWEIDKIIDSLSLMDCDENNQMFNKFIEFAARSTSLVKDEILSRIREQ